MNEVEVKILDIDTYYYPKKIMELCGELMFAGILTSYFYSGDGLEDKVLRVRRKEPVGVENKPNIYEVTLKTDLKQGDVKSANEIEFKVDSIDEIFKFLTALGYKQKKVIVKSRDSYRLRGRNIEFDTIGDLPTFMEIEANSKELVYEIVDLLEIPHDQCKNWNNKQVIEHYAKQDKQS